MELRESIRTAVDGLIANKLRSFLSMLGIIIGIAAVVAIVAITQGSQQQIFKTIEGLGTNLINVYPGSIRGFAGRRVQSISDLFTLEDAERIKQKAPAVKDVVPIVSSNLLLQYGNNNVQTSVQGVTPAYEEVLNFHVATGRFLSASDLELYATVAVIGTGVAEELFGQQNPVGKHITVSNDNTRYKFTVVGLMEEKGQVMWSNFDDMVLIPITTAQKRILHTSYVNSFAIGAVNKESAEEAVRQIDAIFYQKTQDTTKYTIRSQEELLSTVQDMTQIFTVMFVGIAGISLLVGGIGIMNIMLVSVTERTREIGTRMAVGAKRSDILLQFLWESVLLCLIGGIIGVGLGWIGSTSLSVLGPRLFPQMSSIPTVISPGTVFVALGFSCAVGLFFGVYPANKASKLNPVEALQYE